MDFPFGEQLTIVTRSVSSENDYGNDVPVESSIVAVGAIGPALGIEQTSGQDQTTIQPQAFFVGDEAVKVDSLLTSTSAIVREDGRRYEVDGEPSGLIRNPFTGLNAGIQVPLKRVTG